jgi:hypothetical protein
MDTLSIVHAGLMTVACACLFALRARHLGLALLAASFVDAAYAIGSSWQVETALAFCLPAALFVAAANTVGASVRLSSVLATPLVFVTAAAVGRGESLQACGVAWLLVAANAYTAIVGTVLVRIGARGVARVSAGMLGLVLATSAPACVGWSLYASGHSMASAAYVDCVFLCAIVVASAAEWMHRRRSQKSSSLASLA